ncbi:hypothetical protein SEVIR_8G239450v4 [Setaria viridis]|uniref:Uncharacterized protein n=1 Tax=Setaria viridis TaxID=4556 RepID=A0A4U6TX69_SETVI|nr:hypothetical protein SEVIR_8G239450v2 [Setaria viridis]
MVRAPVRAPGEEIQQDRHGAKRNRLRIRSGVDQIYCSPKAISPGADPCTPRPGPPAFEEAVPRSTPVPPRLRLRLRRPATAPIPRRRDTSGAAVELSSAHLSCWE